jgi:hypothetical protein
MSSTHRQIDPATAECGRTPAEAASNGDEKVAATAGSDLSDWHVMSLRALAIPQTESIDTPHTGADRHARVHTTAERVDRLFGACDRSEASTILQQNILRYRMEESQ